MARSSYRQPFPLANRTEITEQFLLLDDGDDTLRFAPDEDFIVTAMGGPGDLTGDLVFVGYSIEDGPDGYTSYGEDDDLAGKIAVMLRFEPMDENGKSLWGSSRWSRRASFRGKVRSAADRGAAAIIIVNTPGADDPRTGQLESSGGAARGVPVLMMSTAAGERLVEQVGAGGRSLMDMRRHADEGGGVVPLRGRVWLRAGMESKPLMAENVGGLLPGRGELADEYIVVGAHLDHLGMGDFGSRSGPGALHPGADDNASGTAGIMIMAEKLAAAYEGLGPDEPARSILFLAFSAEESGLNGSRYYVDHPIESLGQHVLMINFDMIGRIVNDRLSVSGVNSAEGFEAWLDPFFEKSGLEIVKSRSGPGGSDHLSFFRKQIPILFGIIADFHDDYHTPRDVEWKINRVGAVKTVRMFTDITYGVATRPDRLVFTRSGSSGERPAGGGGPSLADIKVRFGIIPDGYDEDQAGIAVRDVSEGGAAEQAGLKAGDVLVTWDGKKIEGIRHWMELLAGHEPGDVVEVGVARGDDTVTLKATLLAKEERSGG